MFWLALEMKRPVQELLTGEPGPLSDWELQLWKAFFQTFGHSTDRIRFETRKSQSAKVFVETIASNPGVRVKRFTIPKNGNGE